MVDTFDEKVTIGDVVKNEYDYRYCRERVTLLKVAEQVTDLVVGELLEPSSSKFVVVATGASCSAILLEDVEAADLAAADVVALALVRGPAIIDSDRINVTSGQKTTALAALKALHIISMTEPTELSEGPEETDD
jgi:hypothetical protein